MVETNSFGKIKQKQQRDLTNTECLEELSSGQAPKPQLLVNSNGHIHEKWCSPITLTPYQFNNFVITKNCFIAVLPISVQCTLKKHFLLV
jgi:hypothetical protein